MTSRGPISVQAGHENLVPIRIFRDLKSTNILLAEETGSTLKICDFGMSTVNKTRLQHAASSKMYGTVRWMVGSVLGAYLYLRSLGTRNREAEI